MLFGGFLHKKLLKRDQELGSYLGTNCPRVGMLTETPPPGLHAKHSTRKQASCAQKTKFSWALRVAKIALAILSTTKMRCIFEVPEMQKHFRDEPGVQILSLGAKRHHPDLNQETLSGTSSLVFTSRLAQYRIVPWWQYPFQVRFNIKS